MDLAHLPLDLAGLLALAAGLGWAAGLRLYTVVFVVGLAGHLGIADLPPGLRVLQHPWVFGAAGVMLFIEFFADKIPLLDTAWDTVHTFIRIPAGGLLAAAAASPVAPELSLVSGVLGAGLAAGTHATKSGSRLLINTSPEPFSNWGASLGEDALAIGAIWLAIYHPWLFLAVAALFLLVLAWLLPKVWRGVRMLLARVAQLFRPPAPPAS